MTALQLFMHVFSCSRCSKHAGVAHWREVLSQVSTIYTDAKHAADVDEKVHKCSPADAALWHNTKHITKHRSASLQKLCANVCQHLQEYIFKVQATTQLGQDEDRLITVGKVKIDMAQYAMLGNKEHLTTLQMPFSLGRTFTQALPFGQLRLKVSAHMVKVSCHATAHCWRTPSEQLPMLLLLLQPVHSPKHQPAFAMLASVPA